MDGADSGEAGSSTLYLERRRGKYGVHGHVHWTGDSAYHSVIIWCVSSVYTCVL
jgi:hypothetical protein